MGAAGTSNVAGGTSGVASAFSSIYNNFKKFSCEFLRQEIVQVLHKVIVQVFSQVAFQVFFFFKNNVFGCKFRAAFATTSRWPLRNAVIPARDGNAELVMKKSLLHIICPFEKVSPTTRS